MSLSPSLLEHTPWENENNSIWLASSLTLQRNLSRTRFPSKLTEKEACSLLDPLRQALEKAPELTKTLFLPADATSSLDKEFLFEHFLCSESFQNTIKGQAFLIDASGQFLASLNLNNHLQLLITDCNSDLESAWSRLCSIEHTIGKTLAFAYSPKFGYLTADPKKSGTAFSVTTYLHLPALIHTKQLLDTLSKQKDDSLEALSLEGPLDTCVGDIVILRNKYTLGLSEESIIRSIHGTTMKLMAAEKAVRSHLKTSNSAEIKDQISRAHGLLLHSYQLKTREALDALSLLKLGLDLGWITGITNAKLSDILFKCRRAHLTHFLKEKNLDDLSRKRAEFIHTALKDVRFQG